MRNVQSEPSRPLVSICMPTYNRAHMVGLAIDSILDQTYSNFELIIVNDGSRDGTAELLARYAATEPRIRVINKANEGISDTVNRGWSEAVGEFVTWTSDDNLYHSTALQVMVEFLVRNPGVTLVYADHRDIDADGNILGYPPGREPSALETESVIYGCMLFRRSIFSETEMFVKRWKRCHDYEFYRRVYKRYNMARIPEVLYDYRRHEASMTGNHYAITTEHAELLASVAESRQFARIAWGWCWHEIARQAQRDLRPVAAAWYSLRAALNDGSRYLDARRAVVTAVYSFMPTALRRMWRKLKKPMAGNI